ncbi:Npt1/Npt2 family nucleotide transporter [Flagellimonas nanhaiensis]|uniref:ADP,ATP carrier protein n=1 Tax=Flagellimonas nanhaiensis TaxID=2292706 RepID=A0A371JN13_9FLAO|nr:Npt1/Npt2 family nucleotide transporter [Allomuricauda nanhaiensis]RDY58635.1 MFS transporter [Allomuricauda nanhaiensis]
MTLSNRLKKIFNVRDGETRTVLLMQAYIFLVIATLLIIKPVVNSLFLTGPGADQLPFAYLLVAATAIISSMAYSRLSERLPMLRLMRSTLWISILCLLLLVLLLYLELTAGWILYLFYAGVAIYAVLASSQFWVLANLIFNVRQAKRLFGIIGAGAIAGGIFGGYLTTVLAPLIGNKNLMLLAVLLLLLCFPVLVKIRNLFPDKLQLSKQKRHLAKPAESPFKLILGSRHLLYLAGIIGIGVLTARLVDYQFSYVASRKIEDSDALASFFGFWLSSFNVASLLIQLFITQRIVGVWGVGFSLLLLPILLFLGGALFLVFPELWVVILMRATDGSFKQSINRSATELIALPLPYALKKKTKSFIDVVVDSVATGIGGILLIVLIQGLQLQGAYIIGLILALTLIWSYFILKVRKEYFLTFRKNLAQLHPVRKKSMKVITGESFLGGMQRVFREGGEREILFMLEKAKEINDDRLSGAIKNLLTHPSHRVKAAALRSLHHFDQGAIPIKVAHLLNVEDMEVVHAALEYLLVHAETNEGIVFEHYLDHTNPLIAEAALVCLARESTEHPELAIRFELRGRIEDKAVQPPAADLDQNVQQESVFLSLVGLSGYEDYYGAIFDGLKSPDIRLRQAAFSAAVYSRDFRFLESLLSWLPDKQLRPLATRSLLGYGGEAIPIIASRLGHKDFPLDQKRNLPGLLGAFGSQQAVHALFRGFIEAEDLTVRLRCVLELTKLKEVAPQLYFDEKKVARLILEECKLYNHTLMAMHTQIIVHYLRRKKMRPPLQISEMDARESLMVLLERRLEGGLERIFKLLELRYNSKDVRSVYQGILSEEQEQRTNAIEFLDLLLNIDLKTALIPIVEATILDTSSEEVIAHMANSSYTEFDCFKNILEGRDLRLKLAVLYLMVQQQDPRYQVLLKPLLNDRDPKLRQFADQAYVKMPLTETL